MTVAVVGAGAGGCDVGWRGRSYHGGGGRGSVWRRSGRNWRRRPMRERERGAWSSVVEGIRGRLVIRGPLSMRQSGHLTGTRKVRGRGVFLLTAAERFK